MVSEDNVDPRKLVLGFVSEHKGCMKEDVVEGLKSEISRVPVLNIINELLRENTLINKSNNRRDYKLFLNTDNLLVTVPEELKEFEKAYVSLLKNILKRINDKDFSVISKLLDIRESDPTKWNEVDLVKFSKFEFERWMNSLKIVREDLMEIEKITNILDDSAARLAKLKSEINSINYKIIDKVHRKEFSGIPSLHIGNICTEIEREILTLDIHPGIFSYDIREFEISLLTQGAVAIFYIFKDTLFYRSILIWPNTISDKDTLNKLYTIVYTGIANSQTHLVKFLKSSRVRLIVNPLEYKNPIEYIISFTENLDKYAIPSLLLYYYQMGMIEFVAPAAASISCINQEIKNYGCSNPRFQRLEEGFDNVDKIKETIRKKQEVKKVLEQLKTMVQEQIKRIRRYDKQSTIE